MKPIIRKAFFLYVITCIAAAIQVCPLYGQTVTGADTTIATNSQKAADSNVEKPMTFTSGLVFCNNADFYGQTATEKLPYIALAASLRLRMGIYFSGVSYRILSDSSRNPFISASGLGIGYSIDISKKLNADLSYTHNFYPSNSSLLQAGTTGTASAALKYQYWLATQMTLDYFIGNEQDYYVTLGNSKSIDFPVSSGKAIYSITPSVDVVAGTQRFYETYLIKKQNKGKGKGVPPVQEETKEYNSFGIVSYNLKLPVGYNRSNYLVELAYQLSVLGKNAASGQGTANSFITLSAFYQF